MQCGRPRKFCVREVFGGDLNARREVAKAGIRMVQSSNDAKDAATEPSLVSFVRVDRASSADVRMISE